MTAVLVCRTCGIEPVENARFCHGCGSPISQNDTPAEYKQVTVLFADVVRSMDMAMAVGPERWREIMAELVTRSAAVVQRYGGTLDQFTGDGIMAVFGAPTALEDHALRACLTALGVQDQAKDLAVDIARRDGVDLRLRVGLNSGQVVAGKIGSAGLRYTAIGVQVGMAQRMESVAPPGAVMLSESTARLVEGAAVLGEPQLVRIKGNDEGVPARQLLSVPGRLEGSGGSYSRLVGRAWEVSALTAMLDRSIGGRGSVVSVAGPAGVGKTRLVREGMQLAKSRGVEVFTTFCESHATDVSFRVLARLLRAFGHLRGLDDEAARAQLRAQVPDADPQDLLLLDELLGIAQPGVQLPKIDPDARRRRLTALINAAQLARREPAVFVVEDAHWIDEVSESLLVDLFAVIPQTRSMVLVTYRPDYQGALGRVADAQTIALTALSDSETSMLVAELLGTDPSVDQIGAIITEHAAGNPFFAEEIIREFAERGVLVGQRGSYTCNTDVAEIRVPATVQATIAARIDRLGPAAKQTLSAAAVIGPRFSADLLSSLGIDASVEELVAAELVDQVRFTPRAEYAFRHNLIHAVAYESQLKSDRAAMHRRLASAIEAREPQLADQNAALIAEHLEVAGDLEVAYGWHMRAAAWAARRDITAARLSWERAIRIADALPIEHPNLAAIRIAPRTMLCGLAFVARADVAGARLDELRQLCTTAADKPSLAIGMSGLVMHHAYQARTREAARLGSEAMALIESIGDPNLTVGLSFAGIYAKAMNNEWGDTLRWSQRVIELADGNPSKGKVIFGSPLALALTTRAIARYWLGQSDWRDDLQHALSMARRADHMSYATVVSYVYFMGIPAGALKADDDALREIEDALQIAERSSDDLALAFARMTLGVALAERPTEAERQRGQAVLTEVAETFQRRGHNLGELPLVNVYLARELARGGDLDGAIPLMRAAVEKLTPDGQLLAWAVPAIGVLVDTLLERGGEDDVAEARTMIERLAAVPTDNGLGVRDILILRLSALHARAQGEAATYATLRDRYRELAASQGLDGHIAWAQAMP